ncbi:right-handed parallel beta-helix repeat-containing protein [Tellurirhabdus bombi]|uniref:right-handed parallel beta-helix repeat-containing protein n=1 Tax=Tellurirhabdus bombi TaxID=2907205 RepID=UPI001F257903|nr:right-handed parallel beta-helix repeat-containing protein [Tellurirhabdus bombi]
MKLKLLLCLLTWLLLHDQPQPDRAILPRSATRSTNDVPTHALGLVGWANFDNFNPAGDGIRDDSEKLVKALAYCQTHRLGLFINPTKKYFLKTPIDYAFAGTVAIRSSRTGQPAVFYLPDNEQFPLQLSAKAGSLETTLTKAITTGDQALTLTATTDLKPGDLLHIQTKTAWPIETDTRKGEFNVVQSLTQNQVTLKYPCQDDYSLSDSVLVTHYRPAMVYAKELEFRVRKTDDRPVIGLTVLYTQHSQLDRLRIKDAQYASLMLYGCYDTKVTDCVVEGANEEGAGYGIGTVGGWRYSVLHNTSHGCRKLCDFSGDSDRGPTRHSEAIANKAYGQGKTNLGNDLFQVQSFCVATHGGADGILIERNIAYNCQTGFQLRGRNIILNANQILGESLYPISLAGGQNHTVTNNIYQALLQNAAKNQAPDYPNYPKGVIGLSENLLHSGHIIIRNNQFDFVRNYGIYGNDVRQHCTISDNRFIFNTFGKAEPKPQIVYFEQLTSPLSDLQIQHNTWQMASANLAMPRVQVILRRDSTYSEGPLIDWVSSEIQGLQATHVLTMTTGKNNSPQAVDMDNLVINKQGKTITLAGELSFTLNRAAQPFINGMPAPIPAEDYFFDFQNQASGSTYKGQVEGKTGQICLGAQASTFGSSFLGGTPFVTRLSLNYTTR